MKYICFVLFTTYVCSIPTILYADVSTFIGKSACYLFNSGKLIKKTNCKIYIESDSPSAYYGFYRYFIKVPSLGTMKINNTIKCKIDDECTTIHTLNNQQAINRYRSTDGENQIIYDHQINQLLDHQSDQKKILNCDKTIDNHVELCWKIADYHYKYIHHSKKPAWVK